MKQFSQEDIECILQNSYYDRRTDYVWKYLLGHVVDLETKLYPIHNLESFQVMHDLLRKRSRTVAKFLKEWQTTDHPELIDCQYNERSGILRLKARSFTLTYRSKCNEYHFVTYAKIARCIGLENRITVKRYRKGGLFALALLQELDQQLYSRYDEKQKVMAWRRSPQFAIDCQYCKDMLPFIMQDAEQRSDSLGADKRMNIILSGNDKVRIGIVQDYSPEEMISMPCYPRAEWKQGIDAAFTALEIKQKEELEQHAIEMQQWSDELSKIALCKRPFSIEERSTKYISDHLVDNYSKMVLAEALGNEQEVLTALEKEFKKRDEVTNRQGLNKMMRDLYISMQEERDRDYLASLEKKKSSQHPLLVELMKYIIQQSAPLVTYTGDNPNVRDNYSMFLYVVDSNRVKILIHFSDWEASEIFEIKNYQTEFRIWWSQQMLKECKYAKQCAIDPEHNYPFDLPF